MTVSRGVRQHVITDNYILWKKFIRLFGLNNRLKRSDLPAYVDMIDLIKENVAIKQK